MARPEYTVWFSVEPECLQLPLQPISIEPWDLEQRIESSEPAVSRTIRGLSH